MIKLNDTIQYRGAFGSGPIKSARVEAMAVTRYPRMKDGIAVHKVEESLVRSNQVIFSLSDGHWCYSDQVVLP